MEVYVRYDKLPPHLPIAIADTREALAKLIGVSPAAIASYISRNIGTYARIEIDDED